jgi:hypothetical protein
MIRQHSSVKQRRRDNILQDKKKEELDYQQNHAYKVGQFNQHGQKIETKHDAVKYSGEVYATQDEAVDRRYSKGEEKVDKRRPSIFGNARANIFGN